MRINAERLNFIVLNRMIKESPDDKIIVDNCLGQRYIGSGLGGKEVIINGTAGNALGAYLDGSVIRVFGDAQDATGDTMNDGTIYVHGNSGDACGYAMRGGKIFIRGNAGYRAGVHMKQYNEKKPVLVVGGCTGSFLGEYLAGGIIIVLGLGFEGRPVVGDYCGTGMHGGKIYLRCDAPPQGLPKQVVVAQATEGDLEEIKPYIEEFCGEFGKGYDIIKSRFYCLTPDTKNPYKQLYDYN